MLKAASLADQKNLKLNPGINQMPRDDKSITGVIPKTANNANRWAAAPLDLFNDFISNRSAFAFDPRNPNAGFRYHVPPHVEEAP